MDKDFLEQEVGDVLTNLEAKLNDETSDEYARAVVNVTRLHKILSDERDYKLKESRNKFDEETRKDQLELDKNKFEFEKRKFEQECDDKSKDRDLDSKRIDYQHEERMAEIKVNQIKAENERTILEQNQIKSEREFKASRRRDWIILGSKIFTGLLLTSVAVLMHKDEIRFERDENGIVPQRCKTYDAIVNKASEMVLG